MSDGRFRVLIDANVFVSVLALDFILRFSEESLDITPLYSSEIEAEVRRVLASKLKNSWEQFHIDGLFDSIDSTFPYSKVSGFDHLVDACQVPESDRHVFAAAIHAEATHLVTFNLRDFPASVFAEFDIEPIHPDAFIELLCKYEPKLSKAIFLSKASRRNIDIDSLASRLDKHLPEAARLARELSVQP